MREHDVIRLLGLEFYGRHGVLTEEKVLGQRFVVDLELYTNFNKAASTDDLGYALNYAQVYELVRDCVINQVYNLIETLAEKIAHVVLENTACQAIKVVLHKPSAPLPGIFRDVSVEIYRTKG